MKILYVECAKKRDAARARGYIMKSLAIVTMETFWVFDCDVTRKLVWVAENFRGR